VIEVR